jgi:Uma2 family endonuclease
MATQTLLTLEDVLALPDRDDCRYEVEEGELIEVTLPRPKHQFVATNILGELFIYLRANPVGRVYGSDTPFVLQREPLTLRGPDAAVILNANLARVNPDQIIEGAPDIAVEVFSPSDRRGKFLRKAAEYLEAGAAEVWLLYPDKAEIHVCTQNDPPRVLHADQNLTSESLPGFSIPIASLFN